MDREQECKDLQKSRKQWLRWISLERRTHSQYVPALPPHLMGSMAVLPTRAVSRSSVTLDSNALESLLTSSHSTYFLPVRGASSDGLPEPEGTTVKSWYVMFALHLSAASWLVGQTAHSRWCCFVHRKEVLKETYQWAAEKAKQTWRNTLFYYKCLLFRFSPNRDFYTPILFIRDVPLLQPSLSKRCVTVNSLVPNGYRVLVVLVSYIVPARLHRFAVPLCARACMPKR